MSSARAAPLAARLTLLRWLLTGQWRTQPGPLLAAVAATAIGVALALGIHLVNRSALDAFRQAIATVNGEADSQVRARAGTLDDRLVDTLAAVAGIAQVSPVLELTVYPDETTRADESTRADGPARGGRAADAALTLLAIDPLAARAVTPALLPVVDRRDDTAAAGSTLALFEADTVFLSDAARQRWPGDFVTVMADGRQRRLRVAGSVPGAAAGQLLAVMDLGSAQWAFASLGRLNRIDLRYAEGESSDALGRRIDAVLPAQAHRVAPESAVERVSNLSRAYRVNLDVLALVALLTGGFIVLAATALGAVRQQPEMALLRVLGAPASLPAGKLLAQGAVVGVLGGAAGVAGGALLAWGLLNAVGGDLGGGYFSPAGSPLRLTPGTALGFGLLGLVTALAGSAVPALAIRRQPAASWLKPGSDERAWATLRVRRPALLLVAIGALLLLAPPWGGLPIAAYAAIAAFLFAGVALVPGVVRRVTAAFAAGLTGHLRRRPALWLAMNRLRRNPSSVAIALAGVVASFALTAAMLIMVSSFRESVDSWLDQALPADLYARTPVSVDAAIDPAMQAAVQAIPGIERARFLRTRQLDPGGDAASITLIARDFGNEPVERQLPLTGAIRAPGPRPGHESAGTADEGSGAGMIRIWVSEAMVSRHGFAPGTTHRLVLGEHPQTVFVAGVWRDYARQTGAIAMDRNDYVRLTGDDRISDVALWLDPQASPAAAATIIEQVRAAAPPLASAEFRSAEAIRSLSLGIFDRSFAVTYVLELVALVVGLFGVASTYAAEAVNRAREFGMLRHLGVPRAMIVRQLGIEAGIATALAVVWGGLLGLVIGAVLIYRVNPQSFHWTMDLTLPVPLLAGAGLALVLTAVFTARRASRSASGVTPILAVRAE